MECQKAKCRYVSSNGVGCLAYAVKGSEYCFFHDPSPAAAAKRKRSLMKGAKLSKRDGLASWANHPIETMAELKGALSELFNAGISGDITTNRLSSLASVANALSKAIEESGLEDRIEDLEKLAKELRP